MKGLHASWPIGRIKTHRLPVEPRVMQDKTGAPYYVWRGTSIKRIAKLSWRLVYAQG